MNPEDSEILEAFEQYIRALIRGEINTALSRGSVEDSIDLRNARDAFVVVVEKHDV